MKQQVIPTSEKHSISGWSIRFFLTIVLSLLALFMGMLIAYLPQVTPRVQSGHSPLLQGTKSGPLPRAIVYAQSDHLWIISSWGGTPQALSTPGYIYSRAVPPLITPSGQLLYSGEGIWLTNPFSGHPRRIASLPADQMITSLALSQDGSQMAWTSASIDGKGTIKLYAGPLEATVLVHQQPTNRCPCFRVFSFLHDSASLGDKTLLLTEDHGDYGAVQHGLWIFHLNEEAAAQPQQLLASDPPQGPLALAPDSSLLLYANWQGYAPVPENRSVPDEVGSLSYANDLNIAAINAQVPKLASSQVIVPEQPLPRPQAIATFVYHWIMTPRFSPNGRILAYIEFTSDVNTPFTRYSALYTVDIHGSETEIILDSPRRLTTANAGYVELGGWLDDHTLALYANDALYAFNVQHKTIEQIIRNGEYAQIIATVERG